VCGLHEHLGQRRVRVDAAGDLLGSQLVAVGQYELWQELRDLGADQVRAQDLTVALVGDDLDPPGPLVQAQGLAIGLEGETANRDVVATLPGLLLGQAHGCTCGWQYVQRGMNR